MNAMNRITRRLALLSIALMAALALVPLSEARAGPLDDAKARGLVGERADGYVGIVDPSTPANIVALVKDINGKRRAKYQGIAASNNTSLQAVEAVAGEKLMQRARPGEFIMDATGRWRRK